MPSRSRPHVAIHVAQSLDGRIALPGPERTILSSRESLVLAHQARASNDAVLVGSATVRSDDPRLTVRECDGTHPRRIVLASTLDVPPNARLFDGGSAVLVVGAEGRASPDAIARLEGAGAEVRLAPASESGWVSLVEALEVIRDWGVERLLVEGGAKVLTSFLRCGLVDDVTIEIAPRWLGAPGISAVGDIGVNGGEHCPGLADLSVERAGATLIVRGRFARV